MIKFVDTKVVFEEIPDKVTLAVSISECPFHCDGCHSNYLQGNLGNELNEIVIDELLKNNDGVNCFLFMGDGNDTKRICELAGYIKKNYPNIKIAIYSGYDKVKEEYISTFDYIKIGKWQKDFGPLNCETTNQRLYLNENSKLSDITYKFWKRL